MAFEANWIWPIAAAPVVGALLTLIVAGVPARVMGEAGCKEPARSMDQMVAEFANSG